MDEVKKEIQPYVNKVMNAVTDTGAIVSQLLGKGLSIHSIKYKKPFDNAEKHFREITKSNKKKLKITDLKHHIKILNKKKNKFKNIQKIKHDKNIELLVGELVD